MDTLRGPFDSDEPADTAGLASDRGWDATEDDSPQSASHHDLPPETIGQDERRMQVRAYNHWAGLLGERMFPPIDDLDPANLPDFGPFGVLLDFTSGIENPAVQFLGDRLAQECGGHGAITRLSDVPPRSLLSRITDHYMQILANQAPIGFEAEFVNQRGAEILYRGILLPFSSNDETIDFIYGVINWKEMADQLMADELLLEIDQALELDEALEVADEPQRRAADPVTDWADSPAHEADDGGPDDQGADDQEADYHGLGDQGLGVDPDAVSAEPQVADSDLPLPDFGQYALDDVEDEDYDEDEGEEDNAGYSFACWPIMSRLPSKKAIDPASPALLIRMRQAISMRPMRWIMPKASMPPAMMNPPCLPITCPRMPGFTIGSPPRANSPTLRMSPRTVAAARCIWRSAAPMISRSPRAKRPRITPN